ncbi:hypothetical protein [Piscinibacter sakaiensis]|uniref:Fumarylacetoacetate hydrolase family protein n=1 Tax=Piscinibacter sakaiensis TaxID=1547922 RepID=A0A0K8NXD1_PISS1|nr:hypothetical protein [Piscinibacter sakaiensis]GAP35036.1 fumarylacetoacetate hydrolase family protein [Piscinibacter sakaiensis]
MKLASYKDGSRDGQLVVVSSDLGLAHYATGIATRLQQVLDDWNFMSPLLEDLARTLDHGKARHAFPFEPGRCLAPLPRGGPWIALEAARPAPDGLRARGGFAPRHGPGVADLAGGGADAQALDVDTRWVVVPGELPAGVGADAALDGVRLVTLACVLLDRRSAAAGADAAPPDAEDERGVWFAPVLATPEALGPAWQGGRLQGTLELRHGGQRLGRLVLDGSGGGPLHAGHALAHLARQRALDGGLVAGPPLRATEPTQGAASLAERRGREAAADGAPRGAWLQPGDTWTVRLLDRDGQAPLGMVELRLGGEPAAGAPDDAAAADGSAAPAAAGLARGGPGDTPAARPGTDGPSDPAA